MDGRLYGMTYSVRYTTLMVSKELWRESTWTIEDVLQIIKEKEVVGTPIEAFSNVWWQSGGQTGEQRKYVRNGQALAYKGFESTFSAFSEDMAAFDNEYFCVGYPTEGESGSYWECGYMLAVNAQAEEIEAILSEEIPAFFHGDKDAETVAEIVQRRV